MSLSKPNSPKARRCANTGAMARHDLSEGVMLGECLDCGYIGRLRPARGERAAEPRLYPHLAYQTLKDFDLPDRRR